MRVEVKDLNIVFEGVCILSNLNLTVGEGEAVLITGPSGSGKTTLLRAILGIVPNVIPGSVRGFIKPEPCMIRSKAYYVPQEPWFSVVTPYVWSEILSFTPSQLRLGDVEDMLSAWGMSGYAFRTTYTLSAGELQRLALMVARLSRKEVVLLDEPASHLDSRNAKKVVRMVNVLRNSGTAVIIVDHDVKAWAGLVDKAYVLRNGTLDEDITSYYKEFDRLISELSKPQVQGDAVLEVRVTKYRPPGSRKIVLEDVEFTVRRGEVALVKGPSGSGKTTLLRLLATSVKEPVSGVRTNVIGKLIYVPDNPLLYFTEPTAAKEVGEGGVEKLREFGIVGREFTPITRLSTGERRRVAVASALVRGASIIVMDEPTVGLDIISKVRVLKAIVKAAEEGMAFVIASHDPLVERIANKVVPIHG